MITKNQIMFIYILIFIVILLCSAVLGGLYWIYDKNLVFSDNIQKQSLSLELEVRIIKKEVSSAITRINSMKDVVTSAIKEEADRLAAEQGPEDDQVDLGTFVQESIITAFKEHIFNEENIKDMQTMMANTIQEVLAKNPMTQAMAENPELTKEQLENVDANVGATVANLVSSVNPLMPELMQRAMGDDWQAQVQANPQTFMLLTQKLQQTGVFNWLQNLTGSLGGNGGNSANKPNISTGSWNY